MTRTQLQSMSVRDLVEYARRAHLNLMQPDGDLLLELAERLNDCYVFYTDGPPYNLYAPWEKETEL